MPVLAEAFRTLFRELNVLLAGLAEGDDLRFA
jgi:hypothetical protein